MTTVSEMARDLRMTLDPVLFAQACGIDPDPWQRLLLTTQKRQVILNCSRQSGKSTVTAIKALHAASYRSKTLVLVVSPTERQSGELLRKVKDAHSALGQAASPIKEVSALRIELENRSRIIALPGAEKNVRTYSGVGLLIIDEASRCEDELYEALRPMLAVSWGQLVILSTPCGRAGFFFEAWHSTSGEWERIRVQADECPRISADFLATERATVGDWSYRQEFFCEFLDADSSVFSYETVMKMLTDDAEPLFSDYAEPFAAGDLREET